MINKTDKKYKIGFEFIWDETPLLVEVADYLRNNFNIEIIGVTLGKRWNNLLQKKSFKLVSLSEYIEKFWDKYREKEKVNLELNYGKDHDLWFFIIVDRLINEVNKNKFSSHEDKIRLLILHFKFWEDFFNKSTIDSFYTTGTAFMGLLSGMAVAQKCNIEFKGIYTTRFSSPRVVFVNNYYDIWQDCNKAFQEVLNKDIPNKERESILNYINLFQKHQHKPVYMLHSWHDSRITFPFIKEFLNRIKRKYIYGWGRDKFDYVSPAPFLRAFKEIKTIIKKIILYNLYFVKDSLLNKKAKFIFLPLQLQPEEACDIHGRYYSDQVSFVENVASSLPLGVNLYVKEHKVAVGKRSGLFAYYDRIKKLPNVSLVHPLANSHEYIKASKMVILNSGTVGWESLIYEKSVIVFGSNFYNYSGLVYKVKTMSELKPIIKYILKGKTKFDKDVLIKFIYAVKKGTYDGYFNVPHSDPRVRKIDNIKCLAKAIIKDIQNTYKSI